MSLFAPRPAIPFRWSCRGRGWRPHPLVLAALLFAPDSVPTVQVVRTILSYVVVAFGHASERHSCTLFRASSLTHVHRAMAITGFVPSGRFDIECDSMVRSPFPGPDCGCPGAPGSHPVMGTPFVVPLLSASVPAALCVSVLALNALRFPRLVGCYCLAVLLASLAIALVESG